MAKRKLSVVLIGAGGNMRAAHVPRILHDGAVRIVAAADPNPQALELLQARLDYEISLHDDWQGMLREHESDGVLISTPHIDHNGQIRRSLRGDRHVLVEKPMVIQPKDARAVLKLAADKKKLLVVAYQRHWMREYVYARELVERGVLGEIRSVNAYVTQNWLGLSGWRLDPVASGGGMFIDTGSHLVASTLWVTSLKPKRASAVGDKAGMKVDVNLVCNVEFEGGAVGSFSSIGNARHHDECLVISGSEGCLVMHSFQWRVRTMLLNNEPVQIPKRVKGSSPDAAFFNGIRRGVDTVEPADFALQVSRMTAAAYRSIEQKKPVYIR